MSIPKENVVHLFIRGNTIHAKGMGYDGHPALALGLFGIRLRSTSKRAMRAALKELISAMQRAGRKVSV